MQSIVFYSQCRYNGVFSSSTLSLHLCDCYTDRSTALSWKELTLHRRAAVHQILRVPCRQSLQRHDNWSPLSGDIVSSIDYSKTDHPSKCTGIYDLHISGNYDVCLNQMIYTKPDEITCILQKAIKEEDPTKHKTKKKQQLT